MTGVDRSLVCEWVRLVPVRYPEYRALLLCGAAWLALIYPLFLPNTHSGLCLPSGLPADGSMSMPWMPMSQTATWLERAEESALHWLLMICAMMVPSLAGSLRLVAERSLWQRRNRSMALVLVGYATPWLLFGSTVELAVASLLAPRKLPLLTATLIVAATWQITPAKRRTLIRCHLEPLIAPSGWKADRGCMRYGMLLAGRCGLSCWALMLACVAGSHALWAMALTSTIVWMERLHPRWRLFGASALALLACVTLARSSLFYR